ncbi:MAG: PfaD family polyunsaturated fatty acid/polyketide biosynthesis protein [Myxococcota bacterium]
MPPIGRYTASPSTPPAPGRDALLAALDRLDVPFAVVDTPAGPAAATGGTATLGDEGDGLPLLAWVPALTPDRLGDPAFRRAWGVRVAYASGAMANGIASTALVAAVARAGGLGFFGAAGLPTARIAAAVDQLEREAPGLAWGVNLIHSPQEPWQEQETVDLLLARGVRAIEASAFVGLTPPLVQLRAAGLRAGPDGAPVPARRIAAKVSRPEVAARFLAPPPAEVLQRLVEQGRLTADEARLAARLPLADDLTAEADSGGHTDNRPLSVLLPLLRAQAAEARRAHGYADRVRVGAAGGIGSPAAAAGAFALGAAYVVTGSVNQACVEADTSPLVKELLAEAGMADVAMAPASDMFEGGVQLQVLRRATMFPMRAQLLYEWYRAYPSLEALPDDVRTRLEQQILRAPVAQIWASCEAYFAERDPAQLERAAQDPKHRMALVFRWYLGRSSRWAIAGEADRRTDLQVWCGPAIGAFNDWTRGTPLARPEARTAVAVMANLMTAVPRPAARRAPARPGDRRSSTLRFRPRPLAAPPAACAAEPARV